MKPIRQIIILALTVLTLATGANAQSPSEQLAQLVTQLQTTPSDNVLRERIIKLAATMKPVPVVPDDGIRFEGRGQYAFKAAKSEADYLAAAQEYEKAVAAAPWVLGYYSDLCTIYDKAGKPADAKRNCSFYLIGLTDPDRITDTKRRIAGLEFGIEKAATDVAKAQQEKADADKTEADKAAVARAAEERRKNSVEGYWFLFDKSPNPLIQIARVGEALVVKPCYDFTTFDVRTTETSLRMRADLFLSGEHFLFVLDLRGGDLVGMTTNLSTNGTKEQRWIRKPWPTKCV